MSYFCQLNALNANLMTQKLILDLGNTLSKAALVESGQIKTVHSFESDESLMHWIKLQPAFSGGIIGSVKELPESWIGLKISPEFFS